MPDDFATRKCHPQIPVAVIHDLWLCFLDQIPRDEYFPHGVISYMMSACPFYGSGFVLTNSLIVFIRLNQLLRSFTLRAPEDLETLPEQDQKPIQCLLGPQQNQALPWHSWISFTSFKLPSGSTVVRAISMCSKFSPPWLRRLTRSMRNVWRLAYNWVKHLMIWCKKHGQQIAKHHRLICQRLFPSGERGSERCLDHMDWTRFAEGVGSSVVQSCLTNGGYRILKTHKSNVTEFKF